MSIIKRPGSAGRHPTTSSPLTGLMDLQKSMNQIFSDLDFPWTSRLEQDFDFAPSCELTDNDKEFVVRFDVPGMNREDIQVTMDKNRLTVSGERKIEKEEEKNKSYLSEIYYGTFTRSFTLPNEVAQEKIDAKYADGVLTIRIPKAAEAPSKSVEIH